MTSSKPQNIIFSDKFADDPYHLSKLIDIEELRALFQDFSEITGLPLGLLDIQGNVIMAINWQEACTHFHRKNPQTCALCVESDTALASHLERGKSYNVYHCRNGLVDVATPVTIHNEHKANLFIGQFLFDRPDLEFFRAQAKRTGLDEQAYLAAIKKVPVLEEETIISHMTFLTRLAEMVGHMGANTLKMNELNLELEKQRDSLQEMVDEQTLELRQALKAANSANRAKSQFLANMSHELRTPLNSVLGFAQLLELGEDDPKRLQFLKHINTSGKGLLELINSLLDLARIEADQMPVQLEAMSLGQLVTEVVEMFSLEATKKDLALCVNLHTDIPSVIEFDYTKLKQVLINLVGNALKFTDCGSVTVHASVEPQPQNDRVKLVLAVEDSGIGISEADQLQIFNSFTQAKNQSISEYGGTGLGLNLCHNLVRLLDGECRLVSEVGQGSLFEISFNDVTVIQSKPHQETLDLIIGTLDLSPFTILVVDDNEINQQVLMSMLTQWQPQLLTAKNGKEAVDMTLDKLPDLIFMDIKMPVMDGMVASKILKNNSKTRQIPIVACTASVMIHEEQATAEFTDMLLRKPIELHKLKAVLEHFFVNATQSV